MLRSAYEAITNSRFGIFPHKPDSESVLKQGNARRYGYRMSAGEGLSVVPVRIQDGRAHLMLGTNPNLPYFDNRPRVNRWVVPDGLLHAAWVLRYNPDQPTIAANAPRLGTELPKHGQFACCWLEKIQHFRPVRYGNETNWEDDFSFWKVRRVALSEQELGDDHPTAIPGSNKYRSLNQFMKTYGYFSITNQSIKQKHDERFFFRDSSLFDDRILISDKVKDAYIKLVADCQTIHEQEIEGRLTNKRLTLDQRHPDAYLGGEPGQTAFSRHSYDSSALKFTDGTLCYGHLDPNTKELKALYPVMISRKLYEMSPLDLLPEPSKLRPATNRKELSPADRVFGWVSQDSSTGTDPAHKSQVRFGVVTCNSDDAVDDFNGRTKTLAILGQPKPAQGRFYVGKADGSAQENGESKEKRGYTGSNRLRGPKVYPHHKLVIQPNHKLVIQPMAYSAEKSNQNRSITGWVKPDKTFEFDLHVTNLSKFELGALLWLLELPPEHFLRLGLAKPLGFGSVRLEVVSDTTVIADGAEWTNIIGTNGQPNCIDWKSIIADFEATMTQSNATLLRSFRKSAAGFANNHPICYPPAQPGARPQAGAEAGGQHYQWFTANEREGRDAGQKLCLPDLHHDEDDSIALPAVPRA